MFVCNHSCITKPITATNIKTMIENHAFEKKYINNLEVI